MAWYNSLKDLGHDVGSIASNPFVEGGLGLLTGGATIPLIAGGVGGLLKPGGNIGQGLKGAAQGGLAGLAGSNIGGAIKGALPAVLGGGGKGLGGIDLSALTRGLGIGGAAGGGGQGGFNLSSLIDPALGVGALAQAAKLQGQSSDYAKNAYQQAQDAYNSRGGLRTAGVAGMLNPQSGIDLSGLRSTAGVGNPFAPKPGGIPLPQTPQRVA